MRKVSIAVVCLLIIMLAFSGVAQAQDISVVINGSEKNFTPAPVIKDGSTLVPMRAFFEALGCNVDWDNQTRTAIGSRNGIKVELPIGSTSAFVNGQPKTLAVKAQLIDNSTFIPLRFVGEALGDLVEWEGSTSTITITSEVVTAIAKEPGKQMTIHFIDVGQADSIFIDFGDYDILIDAGNNADGPKVVNYLKSLDTDDIELMVATHPHEDHLGGLDDVLAAFEVEKIIDSGKAHTTKTYEDYYNAATSEPGAKFIEDKDMEFDMDDGAVFKIIEAGDDFEDLNANSVVTMLDYNDVEILFTGDLDAEGEAQILTKGINADVLKVGHHGSRTASSSIFLKNVSPEFAIISAGKDNSYGHPHEEAFARLRAFTDKIYGTWEDGTIVVTTDGTSYFVNADTKVSVDVPDQAIQGGGNVKIVSIDLAEEIVTLKNNSNLDVNLTGWKLVSVTGNQTFDFPSDYILTAGATVNVLSGRGAIEGINSLKWTGSHIWNNEGDSGKLVNSSGVIVSEYP